MKDHFSSVLRRQNSHQATEPLVFAVWWVADAEIDLRAVVENATGIGVSPKTPFAVVLAHPGIAHATEGQFVDEGLNGAIVDHGIPGLGRIEDAFGNALVFREDIKTERVRTGIDVTNDLLDAANFDHRQDWAEHF